jgi:hypothetical protein
VANVADGERLIHHVYYSLRNGSNWNKTLLIITYDEHWGCYDHAPTPGKAIPPDDSIGQFGFDFTRFGVRVPTVLVSPWIAAGAVFRAPAGGNPFDHTSTLSTTNAGGGAPPLTARDAAAPTMAGVLNESQARSIDDDPIAGVEPPTARASPARDLLSHLLRVHADSSPNYPVPTGIDQPAISWHHLGRPLTTRGLLRREPTNGGIGWLDTPRHAAGTPVYSAHGDLVSPSGRNHDQFRAVGEDRRVLRTQHPRADDSMSSSSITFGQRSVNRRYLLAGEQAVALASTNPRQ